MPTSPSRPDDSLPERDSYDRYSHVKTDSGDIIYDTEHEDAWIQASDALRLDDWQ